MLSCIDSPRPNQVYSGIVPIQGWVVSGKERPLVEVYIDGKMVTSLDTDQPRPDVLLAHGNVSPISNVGFAGVTYTNFFEDGTHLASFVLRCQNGDTVQLASFNISLETRLERFTLPEERIPGIYFRRSPEEGLNRFQRVASILECPSCRSDKFMASRFGLECAVCKKSYCVIDNVPIFYMQSNRKSEPHGLVSTNPYPKHVLDCIQSSKGLVLDYGAGGRPYGYANVVQAEIFRYGFTDVVVDGDGPLPFKDNMFSAVISIAVLEHVRKPDLYVSEIRRVLRPGAVAFIESAFLQPLHACPDHYFNTTLAGLKELCREYEIVDAGVRPYQEPYLSLLSLLEAYRDRLSEHRREVFLGLEIGQLLGYLGKLRKGAEDTLELKMIEPTKMIDHIAAGVYVEARKPEVLSE